MKLIQQLYRASINRLAWGLLALAGLSFELCALFFQHVMKLDPCVMCVYERVAMFGLIVAGLIGMLSPKNIVTRVAGLGVWGLASYQGMMLAIEHADYQFNPSPFKQCAIFPNFPSWAPLDQWFPWMFHPTGECSKVVWQFLGLSMPQWLIVIFAVSLVVCGCVVLSQLLGKKAQN